MVRHLILGSGANFLVSFASLVLLARLFPLDFIADVKAVTVYGGWLSAVLTLQVHSAFLFYHREDGDSGDAVRALSLTFLFGAAVVAGVAFYLIFPLVYEPVGIHAVGLAAFSGSVALALLFAATPAVFTAHGSGRALSTLMLLYPTASLGALVIAYFGALDVNGYALAQLGLTGAVIAASEWRKHLAFVLGHMGGWWRGYTPDFGRYSGRITAAVMLESFGDRMDKMFASRLGPEVFGRYSILCFENPLVGVLLSSYGLALVRDFRGGVRGREAQFTEYWDRMVRFVTFVTFPISFFLWLHGAWFINAVLGGRFVEGGVVFKVYLLVTLLRHAPFQALLRMEGTVHYNVAMATAFVVAAVAVAGGVIAFHLPWQYLALGYLAGWLAFNVMAVALFCRRTAVPVRSVAALDVWAARATQCMGALAVALLAPGRNPVMEGGIFSVVYLVLVFSFDAPLREQARDLGNRLASRR